MFPSEQNKEAAAFSDSDSNHCIVFLSSVWSFNSVE